MKWLRNYFGFNKTETYGVVIIHAIILCLVVGPILFEQFLISKIDLEQFRDDPLMGEVKSEEPVSAKDSLFVFDPNEISKDQFVVLGLPELLADRIINFRTKGGSFRNAKDLNIIYGIDSLWVHKVSSFVNIPELEIEAAVNNSWPMNSETTNVEYSAKANLDKRDINKADTLALQQLKGIGKVLSKRIMKFRDKLGGFYSMKQLEEVYGLSPEVLSLLTERFLVEENYNPKKIRVNSCSREELEAHPYFNRKIAELIINYRTNHTLTIPEDLLKIPAIDTLFQRKVAPYLSFE